MHEDYYAYNIKMCKKNLEIKAESNLEEEIINSFHYYIHI